MSVNMEDALAEVDRQREAEQSGAAVCGTGRVVPFVDPNSTDIQWMLGIDPPERRWVLDGLLPLGVAGMLAAAGGTGKSYLMLQLGLAVASGRPFLGIDVNEPGGVLMLCAEDEQTEIHRRLLTIINQQRADGDLSEADVERALQRLRIRSTVAMDNRLTAEYDRAVMRTGVGEQVVAVVNALPFETKLIVLDPVSRFRGGDENSNDAATRFVEAVERIRHETGATVLLPHHANKEGIKAGSGALSAEKLRGASALVDGFRWAAMMATLRRDEAHKFGIGPDDAGRYVRLDTVKNSYAPPWEGTWLKRLPGGVLAPTDLTTDKQVVDDESYGAVLNEIERQIQVAERCGSCLTRSKIKRDAGIKKTYGVGWGKIKRYIDQAIENGDLRLEDIGNNNGKKLLVAEI